MKLVNGCFLLAGCCISLLSEARNTNPVYTPETLQLRIPLVDTPTQPGALQEGIFEYMPNGYWRLKSYGIGIPLHAFDIEKVEVIKTATFPVQIFLKINGHLHSGCDAIGKIGQRLINHTFEIFVYHEQMLLLPGANPEPPVYCTDNAPPFSKVAPLSVYGLAAGDYSYIINGSLAGTFNLQSNNSL